MDIEPPVGVVCLFNWLGKPLPPPADIPVSEDKVALARKFLNNLIKPESEEWYLEVGCF